MLFLAKDLEASRVNLLMNDFAAGLPSPLAFLGLGEAIGRTLGAENWTVAVLPVLHRVDVSEGRTKAEAAPSRKSGIFAPIEIAEDLLGLVTVSLLLDIPGVSDDQRVREALVGRRIAGGPIHNRDISVKRATADDTCFNDISRGYAMLPAKPSHAIATGAISELQAFAAELYPAENERGTGWFVPVAVGHRLLEDPASAPRRANTRDPNIPHVFAEPVVGIAELVSVRSRRLKETNEKALPALFWRWKAEGDWVVGHQNYHPNHHAAA
ncbi:MAG: type I-F CRISPR-associated protein Csy2 [Bradyrhizobium sp.]|uniref:type I-F CRISPR-associated protein Csy2 n=1 Tax=Bradyrhizobium sp. TaxID=376 RepID=UPI003D12A847